MPVSFINVEQNVNDRFIVKLMPTKVTIITTFPGTKKGSIAPLNR